MKKKRSFVILLFLSILAGIFSFIGYTLVEIKSLKVQELENNNEKKVPSSQENIVPIYVKLDDFTTSLKPENDGDKHVLYIGVTLKLKDHSDKALLAKYFPEVRSRLLLLFSQRTATELESDEGKEKLIDQIKGVVGSPLAGHQVIMVTDVLFDAFILR